jgi:ABC-type Fe3+ transport system permease subunit
LFPGLYRWILDSDLEGLRDQVHIAQIQGAHPFQIFSKILLPQVSQQLGLVGALAFLWAAGDFSLSGILSSGDSTLALLIESLMSAYRLELSTLFMSMLVIFSLAGASFYTSVCYVIGRKYISQLR